MTLIRTRLKLLTLSAIVLLFLQLSACRNREAADPGRSADDPLSTFELVPGFSMELIAGEPLITDPVAMTIDEYGRMYVVEMSGMPLDRSGIGKVILLSDTSHDGKMDKRTVFADSLIMPSGVMRWKNGIIVTDPPLVYYMEDKDGDGRADVREVMLAGFDTSNLEGNVNNPIYGMDNWIYLASSSGIRGGNIHFPDRPRMKLREGNVRFRPDQRLIEPLAGRTQYGHTFDEWGNHFMLNNHYHIFHEVIQSRYLERNPDLVVGRATQLMPDHSEVFSIAENPEYQMLTEIGVFTSACGLTAYTGGAFPEGYNTNVMFVAEPASNILHVDRLIDSGVTYNAKRIFERKEFLASRDPYSRLVNMYVGPDGALYVADFYRQVIEGPEFMSEEVKSRINLYNGNDKGRIYRITAEGAGPAGWTDRLTLGDETNEQLVGYLDNRNSWWRINAQRLLVQRNAGDAVPALGRMAKSNSPVGRIHALWTLQGLNRLSPDLILSALEDPVPGVRINAIKLAEQHLSSDKRLSAALLGMQRDDDPKVRFQLVCALGFLNSPAADSVRLQLLFRDLNDKWMQVAALSANSSQAPSLLEGVLARFDPSVDAYASLVQMLAGIIAKRQGVTAVKQLVRRATAEADSAGFRWRAALLEGLADGLNNRKSGLTGFDNERKLLVRTALENRSAPLRKSARRLLGVTGIPSGEEERAAMQKAEIIGANTGLSQEERAGAIDFIALGDPAAHEAFLKSLVQPRIPVMVQLAAIRTMGRIKGEEVTKYLLEKWPSLTPELRVEAINGFLLSDARVKMLLDKVEAGEINKGSISWHQSVQLRSEGEQMNRARVLLTETDVSRKDVIGQYEEALTMKGNAVNGKKVYQQNCAVCHQMAGKAGRTFGPDLGTVHAWPLADILTNILDPNKSIALGYDLWTVKLNNGTSVQGIISAETPTAITLATAEGEIKNIARDDIESLSTLNMSAMPVDLEQKINKQQMADLLTYLKNVQ